MTPAERAIDVLLIEDDPGDELITREAFEHNKIKNNLHVAHDGEEGLDFLYRRGPYADAPQPDRESIEPSAGPVVPLRQNDQ